MSKKLYSKFDFQVPLRNIYERIGVAHRRPGQFDLALQSYKKSMQFGSNPNEPTMRIRYHQGLGAIHSEMGHYTKAENAYSESLQLAQTLNDEQLEATALIALGALSDEIGDYKKSLEFHQKALEKLRIEGTPFLIADIWSRLTELHAKNDEIEKAKRAAANAIEQ